MAEYLASKVISVAQGEVGYHEKKSGEDLNQKPGTGTGSVNRTKYHRDMGHSFGDPWCQTFVDWCFVQAYGKEGAKYLLCNASTTASTMSMKDAFASAGQLTDSPRPGDIWWRKRTGGGHVGLITSASISGNTIIIRTIEGNTSSDGSGGSDWNGDGVYPKSHTITNGVDENGNKSWFGHPKYSGQGDLVEYTGGAVSEDSNTGGFSLGNLFSGATSFLSGAADALGSAILGLGSAIGSRLMGQYVSSTFELAYETVTTEIVRDEIKSVDDYEVEKSGNNLLSYPSLVEAPYVILQVGEFKFGTYSKQSINGSLNINYPNFIQRLEVVKINGQVNQYTINLVYQIQYGDDPNLLDRIFSTVGYGTVKISYGDWSSPTFVYKEEEAIITNLSSNIDFGSSRITYTVKCTSNALVLASGYFDFPHYDSAKPSKIIENMLYNNQYGLLEVFTGMTNKTKVKSLGLIASDDKSVEIEAKHGMDALSYINYLVTCMSSVTNSSDEPIKDSTYLMTIYDDSFGDKDLNGSYFKITKILSSSGALSTADTYSVDVGFPTNNMVAGFNISNSNSWALLYNYSDSVNTSEYVYSIDNKGNLITQYSPAVAVSSDHFKMTETQKTWWTNMTQFPIKAELTIKGLVRSTMLMTYLRVNAMFYGQRHIASGLYTITKQIDSIDGNGYRTRLSLLRVAGDNDYIVRTKTQVTSNLPVSVITKQSEPAVETTEQTDSFLVRALSGVADYFTSPINAGISSGNYSGGSFSESSYSGSTNSYAVQSTGNLASDIWNTLMSIIQNPYGVAGVMGNLYYESQGLKPTRVEYALTSKIKKLGNEWIAKYNSYGVDLSTSDSVDSTYTQAVDTGRLPLEEFISPLKGANFNGKTTHQYGYGLAQWTSSNRKKGLYNLCKSNGASIGDPVSQCQFLCQELSTGYSSVLNALRSATNINSASDIFLEKFESPANPNQSRSQRRSRAKQYYDLYANK